MEELEDRSPLMLMPFLPLLEGGAEGEKLEKSGKYHFFGRMNLYFGKGQKPKPFLLNPL